MHGTLNKLKVEVEKFVLDPVQWGSGMRALVVIAEYFAIDKAQ